MNFKEFYQAIKEIEDGFQMVYGLDAYLDEIGTDYLRNEIQFIAKVDWCEDQHLLNLHIDDLKDEKITAKFIAKLIRDEKKKEEKERTEREAKRLAAKEAAERAKELEMYQELKKKFEK